ncbi:hypothetical protein [Aeromicrobium sp. 179-A 4D2 NHS]|uniref:hypothetical protein n=1 Tax=Aeromicrobium sp. 179-A 4D2 NHS TaxID=3142375 RepID=UPI0039A37D46
MNRTTSSPTRTEVLWVVLAIVCAACTVVFCVTWLVGETLLVQVGMSLAMTGLMMLNWNIERRARLSTDVAR